MKKMILAGVAAALALGCASCIKDGENKTTVTQSVRTWNYMVQKPSDENVIRTLRSDYSFMLTSPATTVKIESTGYKHQLEPTIIRFTTGDMPGVASYFDVDGRKCESIRFRAVDETQNGPDVTGLEGVLTQAVCQPGDVEIKSMPRVLPSTTGHYAFMSYKWEDFTVRTFWPDMTFCGSTHTTFPGSPDGYDSDGIRYRMYLGEHLAADSEHKASIVMYNAKFAPMAPEITVVLKDLKIEYEETGPVLSGENVVPYMVEGGELQETPRYTFDKFEFALEGDLTEARCEYRVAGAFTGTFQGSCLAK